MFRPTPRSIWYILAIGGLGVAAFSVALTEWLLLDPCHLCIFQRLLFGLAGLFALAAALGARVLGYLTVASALGGLWSSLYQSWLQLQPPGAVNCIGGELGPVERLVEWLGQQAPELFLATGFCEDPGLQILGLSLANWGAIAFALGAIAAVWALVASAQRPSARADRGD
ncbi:MULTISPECIES: disulfide bond formation protein B [Marichromatium]|uniref:Thiol:disulfide interchange protein DsbB n=1 Tax=Marichromatium gracile TaxID=1048 RepID=A0A4R4A5W9_MARGR|nr:MULTISPECIES: disulfide bond formation protein B [Marichromatium]MBK1709646.1 disulfide bond formation protein B [Marichromatium gracile]RNE88464.1 disulfide bond formation protein B [Marichromatium sp. AB31]RNE92366.1 disulfide bond formation protein B [Marichromatium sp. AB32]TCW34055.1 thiol:disulfide interchange protein DsbB [Marichromatium gracile]